MSIVNSYVDFLFRAAPDRSGKRRQNPVTGGYWLPGDDPIEPQKRAARRALLARDWFANYAPYDAPPLPLTDLELGELKYTSPLGHIVSCFAFSLRAHDWDYNIHPSFEDFARGVLASDHAPDFVRADKALCKQYPPHPLRGLGSGLCWDSGH
jgi:hypothetical protein